MATSRVRGHGERLLLSANEVITWGSVSLHVRGGEGSGSGCECLPSDTAAIFSYLTPPMDGMTCEVARCEGLTHIWSRPLGMITNGSEIAGPQSGSSLSNECSHANRQSPHKPLGRSSRLLRFRRLMYGLHANMVCVVLHTLACDLFQFTGPESHEQTV